MIWVRRIISIPFFIVLVLAVQIAVILNDVDETLLSPDFYAEALSEEDLYSFALNDFLLSLIAEARTQPISGLAENPIETTGLTDEQIVESINRGVTPEWVQSIVEQAIIGGGGYITGQEEEFEINLSAGDRAESIAGEVLHIFKQGDAYELIIERVVRPQISQQINRDLPLGLDISEERAIQAVENIISKEWINEQLAYVFEEMTPYLIGRTDKFEISIDLSDRTQVAVNEVKSLLDEADAYSLIYSDIVAPVITSKVGDTIQLSDEIFITDEEITGSLQAVASEEWAKSTAESVIDQVTPYMLGEQDSFEITLDISGNKADAVSELVQIAKTRLKGKTDALEPCSLEQLMKLMEKGSLSTIPDCLPTNEEMRAQLTSFIDDQIDVAVSALKPLILDAIPDQISFDEEVLRQQLQDEKSQEVIDMIDTVRELISGEWSFNERDLNHNLGTYAGGAIPGRLEAARDFLSDDGGYRYNQNDLRKHIVRLGGDETLIMFDDVRDWLGYAPTLKWFPAPVILILILIIGFLGGRKMLERGAWGLVSLILASALVWSLWGPAFDFILEPMLDEQLYLQLNPATFAAMEYGGTQLILAEKIVDITRYMADTVISGVASNSLTICLYSLGIFLIFLILNFLWSMIMRVRRGGPNATMKGTMSQTYYDWREALKNQR